MAEADAPEWIVSTQQALEGIIKRPKLTAALLSKPPFRFLHDIVSEVTRTTGFADGLFQDDELQSGKIKEKELKISYLNKIIKCVEVATGSSIAVRPGKVVAGMEPENTNAFLVQLARAATSGVDNARAVARTLDSVSLAAPPPKPTLLPPPEPPMAAPEPERTTAVAPGMRPQDSSREAVAAEPERQPVQMRTAAPAKAEPAADPAAGGYQRPSTARRRPPKLSTNEVRVEKASGRAPGPVQIMRDGGEEEEEETVLMVDREGEKVDTSSMKPVVDPTVHGKLVRNLLEAQKDLEQAAGEKGGQKAAGGGEGGIIIGKKKGEAAPQSRTDITKLRSAIQTLCQSCNPLGRCLEYVHEDLEAMAKELEQWKALRRRKMAELAEEEAKTEASLFGLQQELAMAEQDVADKRAQIRFFKASVVKNDGAVEKLLAQVVNVE